MCTSGCLTQDHSSWGECVRAKNLQTCYDNPVSGYDRSKQKVWDAELKLYRDARAQGIQPASTKTPDIRAAEHLSDLSGVAFNAAP